MIGSILEKSQRRNEISGTALVQSMAFHIWYLVDIEPAKLRIDTTQIHQKIYHYQISSTIENQSLKELQIKHQ